MNKPEKTNIKKETTNNFEISNVQNQNSV